MVPPALQTQDQDVVQGGDAPQRRSACDSRGEGIPFFEYRWAYLYNAGLAEPSLWNNAR